MTESHDVVKFSRALVSALKRNWLLFAALAAFALLAATVGQWYLIPADSNAATQIKSETTMLSCGCHKQRALLQYLVLFFPS